MLFGRLWLRFIPVLTKFCSGLYTISSCKLGIVRIQFLLIVLSRPICRLTLRPPFRLAEAVRLLGLLMRPLRFRGRDRRVLSDL
jgi:hypothetical protein